MKILGLLLLLLGTMLAAAYGSQNIDAISDRSEAAIRAGTLLEHADKAHLAYCRTEATGPEATALKEADGCHPALAGVPYETLLARELEAHAKRAAMPAPADPAVAKARAAWLEATRAAAPAFARLQSIYGGESPRDEWFDAKDVAEDAGKTVQGALNDYCAAAAGKPELADLRDADGCPGKRRSARVDMLNQLAERLLSKEEYDRTAKNGRALTAALVEHIGGEERLETELASMRAAKRAGDFDAALARGRADLAEKRAAAAPEALEGPRAAWLAALDATIEPVAVAATLPDPPSASDRLTGWVEGPGLVFFGGLVLIILGVVLARVSMKREAHRDAAAADATEQKLDAKRPRVVDFGALLGELAADTAALVEEMRGISAPDGRDLDRVKARLESLEHHKTEPLAEARGRLIVRYGMNGFADVMSPFAAGERYMNRAWSTLVDRYWDESTAAVGLAADYFAEARRVLDGLVEGKRAA